MSLQSTIEWTDATWNPVRGCTKLSPGCKNCYAKTFAERFKGVPGHAYERGFELRLVPEKLAEPLKWVTPKMIFVNSMSDLFHTDVPTSYIVSVAGVMAAANWHTFQVLTKRSSRLKALLSNELRDFAALPHIWWGVSVEDKKYGVPRIDDLRESDAGVKFLSIEPLLESLGPLNLAGIDWAIVGGESGCNARPIDPIWVRDIREQCSKYGTAFFFKQWGGKNKKKSGRLLDGRTHDALPSITPNAVPARPVRLDFIKQFTPMENLVQIHA